jgi:hypothetical protein
LNYKLCSRPYKKSEPRKFLASYINNTLVWNSKLQAEQYAKAAQEHLNTGQSIEEIVNRSDRVGDGHAVIAPVRSLNMVRLTGCSIILLPDWVY